MTCSQVELIVFCSCARGVSCVASFITTHEQLHQNRGCYFPMQALLHEGFLFSQFNVWPFDCLRGIHLSTKGTCAARFLNVRSYVDCYIAVRMMDSGLVLYQGKNSLVMLNTERRCKNKMLCVILSKSTIVQMSKMYIYVYDKLKWSAVVQLYFWSFQFAFGR